MATLRGLTPECAPQGIARGSDPCVANWRDITDRDLSTIAMRCATETNCNITPKDILTALQSDDLVCAVHPLRDWLNHLPQYDPEQSGMNLIDMLSAHVHIAGDDTQQTLWRTCFHRWFLAMVL